MNVGTMLLRAAHLRPDATAVVHGDRRLTYAQLAGRALRLGSALRTEAGLVPGDRVALLQRNGPELIESLYGALIAGLVVVPVNARLHAQEVRHIVEDAGAGAIVHGPGFDGLAGALGGLPDLRLTIETGEAYEALLARTEPLAAPEERGPEDLAWLFFTSGTTGRPKGAMWTHRVARVMVMNHLADVCSYAASDVVLHAAPLSHGSGAVLLASVARASTNVLLPGASFDAEAFFGTVEREHVTAVAFLAPTQIVELLDAWDPGYNVSGLRSLVYGGAPMHAEHLRRALDAFGPVLVQIYGQGEAPMTITALSAADHAAFARTGDPRLASSGIPRTDVEVRVAGPAGEPLPAGQEGEVLVRGDVVAAGYWRDAERTRETFGGGWLRTGDVGVLDEQGYLTLLDRSKEVIVSGGTNIYPREVEEAIASLAGVREVAVVGVPDDYWGESVHAIIVPDGHARIDADAVIAHCRARIAGYKKPRTVELADALPKNAYGKVLKRELRDRYWAGRTRRIAG